MSKKATSDSGDWTFVTHKSRKQKTTHKSRVGNIHFHAKVPQSDAFGENSVTQADVKKILGTLKMFRCKWAESRQGARLTTLLRQEFAEQGSIENAIIVGLGSLDPNALRDHLRVCWQLAIFLEILQVLLHAKTRSSSTNLVAAVPIYAQDPVFTLFDKTLLSELSISVLAGTEAIDKCAPSTFLYAPFVDAIVLCPKILAGRDPIIFVGSDIEEVVERLGMPDYAQQTEHEQELVNQSLLIAKDFLGHRRRLPVDFNGFGELGLHGMAVFVQDRILEEQIDMDKGG